MPYRSHSLLTRWVAEFTAADHPTSVIEVLLQDGSHGEDTGLVVVRPRAMDIDLYLEPAAPGEPQFVVTLAHRDTDTTVNALQLLLLSEELKVASALCDFLEGKSRAHSGVEAHEPAPVASPASVAAPAPVAG